MSLTHQSLQILVDRFLAAWNSQDVEAVVGCYTDDLVYRDPNTRGNLQGADDMRRYLRKLFAAWQMHWTAREAFLLDGKDGACFLWKASFGRAGGDETVEADGMDLVVLRGDRIQRNDVYFDRSVLARLGETVKAKSSGEW
ncbi:MAG: nuclear transport factor 2 family protein [Candidatus Wallbacteria bacterium]|nr:nuclear transport factor 2 family protein [Candidatus Wallbacteria bacterium]